MLAAEYETRFGIPQMLARLEDRIFEGLTNAAAKKWPVRFMSAVKPGADLSRVGWQFQYWLFPPFRVGKHSRLPGHGRVRIVDNSSLRKLMRAARRGRVPAERIGVIVRAMEAAAKRAGVFANRKSSGLWIPPGLRASLALGECHVEAAS